MRWSLALVSLAVLGLGGCCSRQVCVVESPGSSSSAQCYEIVSCSPPEGDQGDTAADGSCAGQALQVYSCADAGYGRDCGEYWVWPDEAC